MRRPDLRDARLCHEPEVRLYSQRVQVSQPVADGPDHAVKRWLVERGWPLARRLAMYPYVLGNGQRLGAQNAQGATGQRTGAVGEAATPHAATRDGSASDAATRYGTRAGGSLSAFSRLAVVHGLSSGGDAMVAVALAGSVFFDISAKAAQSRVALSLALTVAPFTVVGPLLGPAVERVRGGRRAIIAASAAGRAACAFFMAMWAHSLLLFPVAFFTLVFSKLYMVAKAALVPSAVGRADDLVLANSKLSIGGSLAGMLAGGFGAVLFEVIGARFLLRFDIVVYLAAVWGALRLRPARRGVVRPASATALHHGVLGPDLADLQPGALRLPPGGIQLAALTTAGLRATIGFVTFLLVFTFRRDGADIIWYGLALGASQVGNVAGALVAPRLRRRAREEWILTAASAVIGAAALSAGVVHWGRHWGAAVLLVAGTSLASASGKLAFDSMVQRDVPVRSRSRSFARFESSFQLCWALGSLVAVLVPMSLSVGFGAVGLVGILGSAAFAGGSVKARRGTLPSWWPGAVPRPEAPPAEADGP
ncbi:MAG: MFS transporter [Acidimicrobiales bacterium]